MLEDLRNKITEQERASSQQHDNHENNTQDGDYTNLKRLPWILNISPKIKRDFKKIRKALPSRRGKICSEFSAKRTSQNYYQIVNQEYTS